MSVDGAEVIIIGAGVLGCAVAYHLAEAGLRPLVLERRGIAQAATSRAAGLLTRARSNPSLLALVRQTYRDLAALEAESGASLGLRTTGSLYVGASEPVKLAHRRDDLDIFLAREFRNGLGGFLGRHIDGARLCCSCDVGQSGECCTAREQILDLQSHKSPWQLYGSLSFEGSLEARRVECQLSAM